MRYFIDALVIWARVMFAVVFFVGLHIQNTYATDKTTTPPDTKSSKETTTVPVKNISNWIRLGNPITIDCETKNIELRYYRDPSVPRLAVVCKIEDWTYLVANNWVENTTYNESQQRS